MSEVKFGRGGIPDWLEPMVRFCSRCGVRLAFGPVAGEERVAATLGEAFEAVASGAEAPGRPEES